jgi:hypothetical protein
MEQTYSVTVVVSVTADSPQEAAKYAMDDLRDMQLNQWNVTVENDQGVIARVVVD